MAIDAGGPGIGSWADQIGRYCQRLATTATFLYAQALSCGDGFWSLHVSAYYRECNEDLMLFLLRRLFAKMCFVLIKPRKSYNQRGIKGAVGPQLNL